MMHELIRSFADENFGSQYHVAPQGHNQTIQPLALIAKENLSYWARTKRRPRKIVLENLDVYLTRDETVRSKVNELKSNLQNDRVLSVNSGVLASISEKEEVEIGNAVSGVHNRNTLFGELNLSSVQEEYYNDMSLRDILRTAKLDPTKIEPYEKNKLYIITGVVYSEKLQIDGKREEREALDAEVKFLPRVEWISKLTQFKAGLSKTERPAPPIERHERAPLLFTFAKVKYDQEKGCLELKQLVGTKLKQRGLLDVVADSVADSIADCLYTSRHEFVVTTKEQWIFEDLMESSENKPETKLQVLTSLFEETLTLSEMKIRVKQYLNLVERIMKSDKMAFQTEIPLSAKDKKLLESTGIEIEYVKLNKSLKILRVSALNRAMVNEFAQMFFQLQEMQEEEWKLFKEFTSKGNVEEKIMKEVGKEIKEQE